MKLQGRSHPNVASQIHREKVQTFLVGLYHPHSRSPIVLGVPLVELAVQRPGDRVDQAQQVQMVGWSNDSVETGILYMDTKLVRVLCAEAVRMLVKDVAKRMSHSAGMRL